jgi:outer membrane protein
MKFLKTTILTLTLLAVLSVPALAQTRIATVDMGKLFSGYWKTKQATIALDSRKTELSKELKDMAENFDKDQAVYKQLLEQANDQALSTEERDKRKQAATDKMQELSSSRTAIDQFDRQAQAQLADQSQRMSANLVSDIQKAVADKAKASGYTLVVNSAAPETIVYASNDNDLTDAVLKQLNLGAPIDVTQPTEPISTLLGGVTNTPGLDLNSH